MSKYAHLTILYWSSLHQVVDNNPPSIQIGFYWHHKLSLVTMSASVEPLNILGLSFIIALRWIKITVAWCDISLITLITDNYCLSTNKTSGIVLKTVNGVLRGNAICRLFEGITTPQATFENILTSPIRIFPWSMCKCNYGFTFGLGYGMFISQN